MASVPGGIADNCAAGYLTGYGNALPLSVDGAGRTTSYVLVDGCGGVYISYLALEYVDWNGPNLLGPTGGNAIDYLLKGMTTTPVRPARARTAPVGWKTRSQVVTRRPGACSAWRSLCAAAATPANPIRIPETSLGNRWSSPLDSRRRRAYTCPP
jgi:hypothetical protein